MRTNMRIAATAVIASAALVAAAPLASAAQHRQAAGPAGAITATVPVTDGETVELTPAELSAIRQIADEIKQEATQNDGPAPGVSAFSAKGEAGKKFIELLKKSPGLVKSAVSKAKEGRAAFNKWMGNQNVAVRGAWWLLSGGVQTWVFDELVKMVQG